MEHSLIHHIDCLHLQEMTVLVITVEHTASHVSWSNLCSLKQLTKNTSGLKSLTTPVRSSCSSGNTSMRPIMAMANGIQNLSMPLNPQMEVVTESQAIDILDDDDDWHDYAYPALHVTTSDDLHDSAVTSGDLHKRVDESDSLNLFKTLDSCNLLPAHSNIAVTPQRPIIFLVPTTMQKLSHKKFMSALLDTGSDASFIHKRCIPLGIQPTTITPKRVVGLHQAQQYNCQVMLGDILLPELSTSKLITKFNFIVSDHDTTPDIILEMIFLVALVSYQIPLPKP